MLAIMWAGPSGAELQAAVGRPRALAARVLRNRRKRGIDGLRHSIEFQGAPPPSASRRIPPDSTSTIRDDGALFAWAGSRIARARSDATT